jgi:glyoxylase I family protein
MYKLCFYHLSIAVDNLERARQFYTNVLEMQELDRPEGFGHSGIWYQIGDGQPQLHILVRSEATLRRDKWIDLADIHFALRVQSYRDTAAWLDSKVCLTYRISTRQLVQQIVYRQNVGL